MRNVDIEGI